MGKTTHGYSYSDTYSSWRNMRSRCDCDCMPNYANYGGRGISYDPAWALFPAFLADMGERPTGTTLARLDNEKPYCKDNCRWATRPEQRRNQRNTKLTAEQARQIRWLVEVGYSKSSVARMFGVTPCTVRQIVAGRIWRTYQVHGGTASQIQEAR